MSDPRRLHGSGRQQRALWRALMPFHDRLAPLSILVDYPEPVAMLIAPATALIAPAGSSEAFGQQIVEVAAGLAKPA
jgi:hypothetical protein